MMSSKLNKYDPKAVCPKCGCTGIKNTHREKGSWKKYPGGRSFSLEDGVQYIVPFEAIVATSYIERECFNCSYIWEELPLDAEEEVEPVGTENKA